MTILDFIDQFNVIPDHNSSYSLIEFLEFSKAFDTLYHEIILQNLEFHCFRGNRLLWLWSFLSKCTQFVELGNKGYTDASLLFLIYINDFTNLNTVHFADDIILYKEIGPTFDTRELTQVELRINANRLLTRDVPIPKFQQIPELWDQPILEILGQPIPGYIICSQFFFLQ